MFIIKQVTDLRKSFCPQCLIEPSFLVQLAVNMRIKSRKTLRRAYKSMSREAQVIVHLMTGVDDEEFEQVWEEESCQGTKIVSQKYRQEPFVVESKKELSHGDNLYTDN